MQTFNADAIAAVVREARALRGFPEAQRFEMMRAKHPDFWESYPILLKHACEDRFDARQMNFMLERLRAVAEARTSMETADRDVRVRLTEEYVNPVVGGLGPGTPGAAPRAPVVNVVSPDGLNVSVVGPDR
jgi:hypothetical protein